MLGIRDILVRIRIRLRLWDPDPDPTPDPTPKRTLRVRPVHSMTLSYNKPEITVNTVVIGLDLRTLLQNSFQDLHENFQKIQLR